mmetsp:Transcript_233/g.415  ORF Transcript_233/g.415 Transcript_233/m.415 type:complete len:109 (-) Transcript_233:506-832(-)
MLPQPPGRHMCIVTLGHATCNLIREGQRVSGSSLDAAEPMTLSWSFCHEPGLILESSAICLGNLMRKFSAASCITRGSLVARSLPVMLEHRHPTLKVLVCLSLQVHPP